MTIDRDTKVKACARAAHEANRAYCMALGDFSVPAWEFAPEWQRTSCVKGVEGALAGATPEQSHESWRAEKVATGWRYGTVKDPETKQHPCMLPYGALPMEQRVKDDIYLSVVRAMAVALESL